MADEMTNTAAPVAANEGGSSSSGPSSRPEGGGGGDRVGRGLRAVPAAVLADRAKADGSSSAAKRFASSASKRLMA